MTVSRGSMAPVADDLVARMDELVSAQMRAVDAIASYERVPRDAMRSSGRRNVLRVVHTLRGDADLPPEEASETESGTERALQGIPAEDVVGAYRVSMGVLREGFLDAAARLQVPAGDIVAATRELWALTDRYSAELVAACRRIDLDLARRQERAQLAFLHRMLTGALTPHEVLSGGPAHGLAPDHLYWVVRGRAAGERAQEVARRLESCAVGALRPLVGWIDGDVVAVTPGRPTDAADGGVLAVAGPVPAAGFPQAFAEATRLLNVATRYGRTGLVDRGTLSVRIAVVEEPELSEALLTKYVDPVTDIGSGAVSLLSTVRTYLACRRSFSDTAARLSVHANTVRYRLSRYLELTGADLEDTETLIEVWWALETWNLHTATSR
ncbi:MAG TPA: helix-turn-helix domain-containing protein [Sporichthyaceae bacterium]|jgi:putative transposase